MQGRKYSRKADSKRTKKAMQCEGDDGTTADTSKQSLSCCTSEIDSNAFQEPPVASKPKGKAQAGRQTTDPQSLYARVCYTSSSQFSAEECFTVN